MACAKIILVATKADGELSLWLPSWIPLWLSSWLPTWLTLPLQPRPDVLASILRKAKNHLSYLFGPDSEPVVFLFDEIMVTSSKIASRDQLHQLHTVIEAMVRGVKPLPKIPIPQCWFTWLQKLRENPSVLITDLPNLRDRQGPPVNITVGEIKQLEKLKDLLAETTPTTPTTPKTHDLLKRESPTMKKTFIADDGSKYGAIHPKAQRISHGQLPSVESKREEANQGTQIPQELDAPITFLREMTEILWYLTLPQLTHPTHTGIELKTQIITDPMHLIRALRSLLSHDVKNFFDKRKPASTGHYKDLTEKGKISFDVFEKNYKGNEFTAAEVWGFLFQLDIACPLDNEESVAFIPSLISNEMEEEFKERLAAIKKSSSTLSQGSQPTPTGGDFLKSDEEHVYSTLCIQYTLERASVGIFYKLLSNFAKAHKMGTNGSEVVLGFVQKVEKRDMAITAGVSGTVRKYSSHEEGQLDFLLHEFETRVDQLHKGTSQRAHPVHKGIRIYLQQKERNTLTKVLQFMEQIHEDFSKLLTSCEAHVSLVCPICLAESAHQTTNDEGYFEMGAKLDLKTVKCSTSKHELTKSLSGIFNDKRMHQGNNQLIVFTIRY